MRYLIVGADSSLASPLIKKIQSQGNIDLHLTTRHKKNTKKNIFFLDLNDKNLKLPQYNYDIVFFLAGITSIKECEYNNLSYICNVKNTLLLAQRLSDAGSKIIFPSTNLVFNGATALSLSTTHTSPQCNYGKYKVEVEESILAMNASHSILRLTKVLNYHYPLFTHWISLLKEGQKIHAFNNLTFAPLGIDLVSTQLLKLANHSLGGIWHLSPKDEISYYDAIYFIAKKLNLNKNNVIKCNAEKKELTFIPKYTTLDSSRIIDTLKIDIPDSYNSLENMLPYWLLNQPSDLL